MKCPKCRNQMRREMIETNRYKYVCPNCHLVIGGDNEQPNNSVSTQGDNESEQ